jgi:hypothetical protein
VGRLEGEGRADGRARIVSGWKRGGEGKELRRRVNWAARREGKGSGPKGEQAGGLVGLHGLKGGRDGFGEFFFSFFKHFSTFQTFEIQTPFQNFSRFKLFPEFKHFKPFQSFQNILKTFKTSHKQTIKPCIQIMMHKHLLLLNY